MTQTLFSSRPMKLLGLLAVAAAGFLMTASSVFACGMTCHGDYFPAGTSEARSITGRNDTGVCTGSVSVESCPGAETDAGRGGGGGGGGGGSSNTDLTVSNTNPVIATQGQSTTYAATVYNGRSAAGETTTTFQTAANSSGAGAATVGSAVTGALNAYASRSVAIDYTHQSGSFYMRACTDSGNVVIESNEGNNCGPWSLVSVVGPSPTVDLSADPTSIAAGANSILEWASTNADICSSTQFDTLGATSGQITVSPSDTTAYNIICRKGGTGAVGTYQYAFSDTSDLSCPITDPNKAYSGLPTCPVNPGGKACTTGPCKRNTVSAYPGICVIETDVYNCVYTAGTSSQQVEDTVTVTVAAGNPDMLGGTITPSTGRAYQASTLSASVLNATGGLAGASRAYVDIVPPSGKGAFTTTVAVPQLATGASHPFSFGYTFAGEGTYTARVCADWFGDVTETNEGNNCEYTYLAVTSTFNPNSVECSVSNTSVALGGSVTYTASANGAAGAPYSWTASDGGNYGSSSSVTRSFATAGPYDMTVSANGGSGPAQCPRVTVAGPACSATPDLTLTATPGRVRADTQTFNVSWEVENTDAASCRLTGTNGYNSGPVTPTSCGIPLRTISQGPISTQTVYTLTCGAESTTAIVNVIPSFQEF